MPDLPEVVQAFQAQMTEYLAAMDAGIAAAQEFAGANREALAAVAELQAGIDALHGRDVSIGIDTSQINAAAQAAANLAAGETQAAEASREEASASNAQAEAARAAADAADRESNSVFRLSEFQKVLRGAQEASNAAALVSIQAYTAQQDALRAVGAAEAGTAGEAESLAQATADAATGDAQAAAMAREFAAAEREAAAAMAETAAAGEVAAAAMRQFSEIETAVAITTRTLPAVTRDAGNAAAVAGGGFRLLGTGIRITGTMLHWIVAGTAEFLATAVPAAIALGAGMLVAAQGAQMAQIHMQSLYTATEATANIFHTTFGQALGLRSALQQAQDAANPGVYEVLGSVINDMRARFGNLAQVGLQVVHVFDEFAARITVDLQGAFGAQIQGMLSGMVKYLTEFGQIFGNLGHALLNFASAMPGLAAVLLSIADAVSRVILAISSLPPWIITTVMAIEEFWRWGGLALRMLIALAAAPAGFVAWLQGANFIRAFGSSLLLIVGAIGRAMFAVGAFIAQSEILPGALRAAGAALAAFGIEVDAVAASLSPLLIAVAVAAAAGVAFLAFKMLTAKDATQQWVASTQKAVQSASDLNVFSVIGNKMAENSVRMAAAQRDLASAVAHTSEVTGVASRYSTSYSSAADRAATDTQALAQNQQFLSGTATRVIANSVALGSALNVTAGAAILLANAAGVNLQQSMAKNSMAFRVAVTQILNLDQGYRAMGHDAGQAGNDMTAVSIQAGLQATQVQKLTQAWDAYMGLLTGGTSTLAGFEQSVTNLTTGTNRISTILGSSGSVTLSVKQFADSLRSFTGTGAQAWQNFNQTVSSGAQSFIDWMDQAAAVGMVSSSQMTGAIKGIVAQMLPFAAHSQAARAELRGLALQANYTGGTSLRQMARWAREGGMSSRELGHFVSGTTVKLSDMAQVAANLGTVLQSALTTAFDTARMKASGLTTDLGTLSTSIQNTGAKSSTTHTDMVNVINDMASLHVSVPTITAMIDSMGLNISQSGVRAIIAAGDLRHLSASQAAVKAEAHAASGAVLNLRDAIAGLHSKSITVTTNLVTHQGIIIGGGGPRGISTHQAGTWHAPPGLSMINEAGPEMVWFSGGERVMSAPETRHFLSPVMPGPTSPGGVGASGGEPLMVEVHSHLYLDGKQVFTAVKVEDAKYSTRNAGRRTGLLRPGT